MRCFRWLVPGLLFCLFIGSESSLAQNPANQITGVWVTAEKDGRVRISRHEDGKYYGKLIWTENKRGGDSLDRDINNPDPEKRDRTILGITLLKGLAYKPEENQWEGGKIYDPNKGKTYKCYAELVSPDKLKIRGYVGISMVGRSTYWKRYQP